MNSGLWKDGALLSLERQGQMLVVQPSGLSSTSLSILYPGPYLVLDITSSPFFPVEILGCLHIKCRGLETIRTRTLTLLSAIKELRRLRSITGRLSKQLLLRAWADAIVESCDLPTEAHAVQPIHAVSRFLVFDVTFAAYRWNDMDPGYSALYLFALFMSTNAFHFTQADIAPATRHSLLID